MRKFWFTGALCVTPARDLSGGERRRLQLLLALSVQPNVLFLDEPTNDLDLETIRLMEEFLRGWAGTLVVVSHDRTFLSRTTERLLEVRSDATVGEVPGGIDAWIERSLARSGPSTASGAVTAPGDAAPAAPAGRRLRDAEKEMTRLERKKQSLTRRILDASDHDELTRLGAELAVVQRDLATAEEGWLALLE